jgi:5-methylcytosine-specific restriction endonuclease McrA
MSRFTGIYTEDWPEISEQIKAKNNYCCERCGHSNDRESGHVLTVHHLDNDKSNMAEWNLAALCQKCHLSIQGKVNWYQQYMFEHSKWLKPYYEGYLKELNNV